MKELPANWCTVNLDQLCVPTEQVEPLPDQTFIYIDISAVDRQAKRITTPQQLLGRDAPSRARKLVRTGDTLVSMTRPNLNAVALVSAEFDGQIASTGFDVLRTAGLEPRWIAYLVRTSAFVEAMSALVQGALYPAVKAKDVRAFTAPLAPLREQQRIADKLDTVLARVDACRDRLARVAPLLKRFRQSVLAAATSGLLTEDWRAELSLADAADALPGTPYSATAMGSLLSGTRTPLKTGPFGTLLSKAEHVEQGIEVVGIENIDRGKFVLGSKIRITPEKALELAAYDLLPGDVIISRSGTVGEVCVVPQGLGALRFSTNIIRVVLDEGLVSPNYFVYLFIGCSEVLRQVDDLCKGSTRAFLNQTILNAITYPIPCREEQNEIGQRVETLFAFADRLEARITQARTSVDRLTPSLLAKAFRGELVPQDPADEPAAELLKRLQSSVAEKPLAGRPRRRAAAASS